MPDPHGPRLELVRTRPCPFCGVADPVLVVLPRTVEQHALGCEQVMAYECQVCLARGPLALEMRTAAEVWNRGLGAPRKDDRMRGDWKGPGVAPDGETSGDVRAGLDADDGFTGQGEDAVVSVRRVGRERVLGAHQGTAERAVFHTSEEGQRSILTQIRLFGEVQRHQAVCWYAIAGVAVLEVAAFVFIVAQGNAYLALLHAASNAPLPGR